MSPRNRPEFFPLIYFLNLRGGVYCQEISYVYTAYCQSFISNQRVLLFVGF
jgi:hypothetical protein